MGPLYIFLDESGNFDFKQKRGATNYFILTALSVQRPFPWEEELNKIRYDIWEKYPTFDIEYFHATSDKQKTRDIVFSLIQKHIQNMRVDSVVVEKRKTFPGLREPEKFYPQMMGHLLKYVFEGHDPTSYTEINVITDKVDHKKRRSIIQKSVKQYLSSMIGGEYKYSVRFHDSKSCYNLQVVDYFCWAISRKWERGDLRSYELVKSVIRSEFDIFRFGTQYF